VEIEVDVGFPGFQEALALVAEGEARRFWIPEELAFKHYPGTTRGPVVYDISVLKVIEMPDPPPAPKNVAAPPQDALRTESGVRYVVLREGTGEMKPGPHTKVEAHFSYWTSKGELLGSSISEDQPRRLGVDRVGKGLSELLQGMVVGEKRRAWVPQELLPPSKVMLNPGTLVYDVDLLGIYKKKIKVDFVDWDVIKPDYLKKAASEAAAQAKQPEAAPRRAP
jgi:peptidylprolyl isomerase